MCGGRGTSGHCGVSVTRGSSCILNKVFTASGKIWCLHQIATTLTTNVIKANAGLEAVVQEGRWLNCISLHNPSYSLLLKPTWTVVFGGERPLSPGISAGTDAASPQPRPHKPEEGRRAQAGVGGSRPGELKGTRGQESSFLIARLAGAVGISCTISPVQWVSCKVQ